jgi:hypothetical protein
MPSDFIPDPKAKEPVHSIGGEPLEGSGFEDEQPEDGFEDGGDDGNN